MGRASGAYITGIKSNARITDLVDAANQTSTEEHHSKKKVARTDFEVLKVALLLNSSADQDFDKTNTNAAKCVFKPGSIEFFADLIWIR